MLVQKSPAIEVLSKVVVLEASATHMANNMSLLNRGGWGGVSGVEIERELLLFSMAGKFAVVDQIRHGG